MGHIYDEAAIAAANLSLINKQSSPEPNKQYNQQKVVVMGDGMGLWFSVKSTKIFDLLLPCRINRIASSTWTLAIPTTWSEPQVKFLTAFDEQLKFKSSIHHRAYSKIMQWLIPVIERFCSVHWLFLPIFFVVVLQDYLNPVPKDQIVRECGLRTVRNENDFYVTDIDPIELGVHMNSSGDDEVLFGDEFNLNYFGVVSGNNIMA